MKKILVTAVILAALYPLAAWVMGFAVAQRFEQLADQGQTAMPSLHLIGTTRHGGLVSDEESRYEMAPMLKITRRYHRGWFSSTDDATIETSGAIPGGTAIRFSLHTVIHHGPICGLACFALAGAETHMSTADASTAVSAAPTASASSGSSAAPTASAQIFGGQDPITIRTRFAFLGGASATATSPPIDHARLGPLATLDWGGLDATMHYGAGQDWYDIAATAPLLRVEGAKGMFEIQGMSLRTHNKRALGTLYAGDTRLEAKRLSVTAPDKGPAFTVDDLAFASQNELQDRFMNVSYRLATGAFAREPLALSSAHMDFTWKHLGLESLESLIVALRASSPNQNASVPPVMRAQNMIAAIKQPLGALLADGPEMDIDRVSMATAQGQGSLTGVIRLSGVGAADIETPALILQKLDARFDLSIDDAFLASLPGAGASASERLQPMIDQGYLERSNGTLHTQIIFRGGRMTVNGKTFNPAALRPATPSPLAPAPGR
jgi:uncharacterized protein YdgA (DUF945 family)